MHIDYCLPAASVAINVAFGFIVSMWSSAPVLWGWLSLRCLRQLNVFPLI